MARTAAGWHLDTPDDLPTHPGVETLPLPDLAPARVGPFHVLRQLGQGGMGTVYLAEQREPLRRQVAIKLVRAGLGDPRLHRRFEAEGQALARLSHPNVARVFEAGSSEGRAFIAMEWVPDGQPIDAYCDARALPIRERLRLFRFACEGVRHAHQKAILHRDLKPSNILVGDIEGRPVPRVIDFGLAKALDEPLSDTALSVDWGILGTPNYLSPEAVEGRGADIDTRTDVYALGVVLFELLTGARPFTADDTSSLLRRILTDDVPAPSQVLGLLSSTERSELARRRGLDPRGHRRALRGELDWIVQKATARDRTARYGTAGDLADEIGRWLADEPLLASPPGRLYRFGKFARRHRAGVAAAGFGVLALSGGLVARSLEAERANREAERANHEARTAGQVSGFLVSMFSQSMPGTRRAGELTARELLAEGSHRLRAELKDEPQVRTRLLDEIGNVNRSLGLYDEARVALTEALVDRRARLGPDATEVAESLESLGALEMETGHPAQAEAMFREGLRILAKQGPEALADSSQPVRLATVVGNVGNHGEAERLLLEALAAREAVFGPEGKPLGGVLNNLGNLYHDTGRYEEAARAHLRGLAVREKTLEPGHVLIAQSLNNLGNVRLRQKRYAEAEELHLKALDIKRRALDPDHQELGVSEHNLGDIALAQGHLDAAEAHYRAGRALFARTLPAGHPYFAYADIGLANVHRERGQAAEAEVLYRGAIASFERSFGPRGTATREAAPDYVEFLRRQGREAEARAAEAHHGLR